MSFRSPAIVSPQTTGTVSLIVDFGDAARERKDIPFVTGQTAFSILKQEVEEAQMPFVYDPSFGDGLILYRSGA
ncbi:hypothetical protein HY625_00075, partial [Candidatus Uhrbacteria bacterium]|nr:hypothetical protein [Candidatus Uhrbacteria bacterium]